MKFQKDYEDGKYSALVGWVIKQGKILIETDNTRIQELREQLQTSASNIDKYPGICDPLWEKGPFTIFY